MFKKGNQINKGRIPWNRGLKATQDERIRKFVEAGHKASKGKPSWSKGKTKKEYPQLSNSGRPKGQIPWNKGKTNVYSKETINKIKEKLKGHIPWNKGLKTGLVPKSAFKKGIHYSSKTEFKKGHGLKEKNPNWKGGKSFEPYTIDWTRSLKISIRERDKYTCQICGEKQGDKTHDVHHKDYDKKNCNPDNLITLCIKCHRKTNHNRKYWNKWFEVARSVN